jgi:hypothetical protein
MKRSSRAVLLAVFSALALATAACSSATGPQNDGPPICVQGQGPLVCQ